MPACLRLWEESEPLAGTIGETYLGFRRVEHLVESKALRFHPSAPHPLHIKLPALVAQVVDVNGTPIGVHRTFLAPDGHGKIVEEPSRACLGPIGGGVIRLSEMNPALPLVIGEGIETAASAGLLKGMPAWAAISAGNLERSLMLPHGIRKVLIAVDPDPAGMRAARSARNRWRQKGRSINFLCLSGSGDFNDLLCAKARETANG